MKKWSRLALVLGVVLLASVIFVGGSGAAHAEAVQDNITYVVKAGDSLGAIAARYGVSVSAIVRANGLVNADRIVVGQRLVIPVAGSTGSSGGASGGGTYYTIKRGDSLGAIAKAYGISASALAAANKISNPNLIVVGQRLYIPGSGGSAPAPKPTSAPSQPSSSGQTVYTVKAGDTLSVIAQRYGTTVAALVSANGLGSADSIRVGQRLVIPRGGGTGPTYPGQATRFEVSISQQRCWLYRGSTLITKWVCSTGRYGSGTKTGTFRIQSKMPKAFGSTWNIWMPYWLGIYWAGSSENGIHGLPWNAKTGAQVWTGYVGTPITYGCVMLDNTNAKMLYDVAYIGMPVVIKP